MEPILAVVIGFIDSAVAADDKMRGVSRVDPECVVVHMAVFTAQLLEGFSAVFGIVGEGFDGIDFIHIFGIAEYFVVILSGAGVGAHFFP